MGGALLGSCVALLYLFRAIHRHRRLDELDDEGDAARAPVPLLAGEAPELGLEGSRSSEAGA